MTEKEFDKRVDDWADDLEERITTAWNNKREVRLWISGTALLIESSLIGYSILFKHSNHSKYLLGIGVFGVVGTVITHVTSKPKKRRKK